MIELQIGRVALEEGALRSFDESWSEDGRSVSLQGTMFSAFGKPRERITSLHDDILGLPLSMMPVLFGVKTHRNGYYKVENAEAGITELNDQNLARLAWKVDLYRCGPSNTVDLESRLSGPTNRLNDHSLTGERWHAPPIGHHAYISKADTPGSVLRTGTEGVVKVYRSIAFDANPRWICPEENYGLGRVRITDQTGERAGIELQLSGRWSMSNSLITVESTNNGISVTATGSPNKDWKITDGGNAVGLPVAVSVLANNYERCAVRVVWARVAAGATNGRLVMDITLRRGSLFAEIVLKCNSSTTLGVIRNVNEAGTAGTGFIRATSNDANGNRYVVGSLKSFTGDLTAGGFTKAAVTKIDAMIGIEVGGSSAVTGNTAANLMAQYVGVPSETVQAVRR